MRSVSLILLAAFLFAPDARAADAEHDEALRNPQQVLFEGVEAFDAAQVKAALAIDLDIQGAARPQKPLSDYLQALETAIVAGYRHSGFPDVAVQARFDLATRTVSARVVEGKRYRSGQVHVTGLDEREAGLLAQALTVPVAPMNAVPVTIEDAQGRAKTIWEGATGRSVKWREPLWKPGAPAPFDRLTLKEIRHHVITHLMTRSLCYAEFRIKIAPETDSEIANLSVTIDDKGPLLTLGEITIEGLSVNSRDDVLSFLRIRPGMKLESRMFSAWEHKLWRSGRFCWAKVAAKSPIRDETRARMDVRIILLEHTQVPPLSRALTSEDETLLKVHDWLARWPDMNSDEDLIVEAQIEASVFPWASLGLKRIIRGRFVMAPKRGQVISWSVAHGNGKPSFVQTLVSRDNRISFYSPQTVERLELPPLGETQLRCEIRYYPTDAGTGQPGGRHFGFVAGVGLGSKIGGNAGPVDIRLSIDPVAVLAWPHTQDCKFTRQAGELRVEGKSFQARLDEHSGRIIDLRFEDKRSGGALRIRTAVGALQQEFEKQEQKMAGSTDGFDPVHPWRSSSLYLINEAFRFAEAELPGEHQKSLAALRKLASLWSPESLDSVLKSSVGVDDDGSNSFVIPLEAVAGNFELVDSLLGRNAASLAGHLTPIYREISPREGWLWPLGRDLILALSGRPPGAIGELSELETAGPVGQWMAALLLEKTDATLARSYANRGLQRLSAAAFRYDYAPLLFGDSWLSRNVLSLAEAVRQLDKSEIQALVRLLPKAAPQKALAQSLLVLKTEPGRPVRYVLPGVINRLWEMLIADWLEAELTALAGSEEEGTAQKIRDARVRPAAANMK